MPQCGHGGMPHDVWSGDDGGSDVLGRGAHSLGNTVHAAVCCLVHPERKKSYYKPNIIHNCNKSILYKKKKKKKR